MLRLLSLSLPLFVLACQGGDDAPPAAATATEIIDRAIAAHGMKGLDHTDITFDFRERTYGIQTEGGRYAYSRSFTDSTGNVIHDTLTNTGLTRHRNDSLIVLTAKDSAAYARSVNSVRYFFMLPYGLHDPAVNAELLPATEIKGQAYDRIRVTFDAEGGGRDHDDIYHYFFNSESGELDYLAYNFVVDGGGVRFREAINKRRIQGVLIQDYVNYGLDGDRGIENIEDRFAAGELKRLSTIENEKVRISPAASEG